jgi:ATP-dependent Zn protease
VTCLSYPKGLGDKTSQAIDKEHKKFILEMSKRAEKQVRKANELIKRLRERK